MNITRLNFRQNLPFILKTIRKCQYYAIDLQMTGILASQKFKNSILDSHQLRYWKTKNGIQKFLPIQLGICGFQILSSQKIVAYPFNFYIYPFVLNDADDRSFSFSSGSMKFLASNNYDFNKLFYQGIFYISKQDEKLYEGQYKAQQIKKSLRKLDKIITPDMRAFSNLHKQNILNWYKNKQEQFQINIKFIRYRCYKHLLQQIRQQYPQIIFYEVYDKIQLYKRQTLKLIKKKPENFRQQIIQETYSLTQHLQLTNLINQISQSSKPIILHNGLLDLMHIYHKFFGILPEKVETFKQKINKTFPIIYDTKFIANNSYVIFNKVNKQTNLENLYRGLINEQKPFIYISQDFKEYSLNPQKSQLHQAGFDALMTGISYFKQMSILKLISQIQNFSFTEKMVYFKNRLPLGNIQIPFNIQEKQEIYKSDRKIYYLQSIIYSPLRQSEIKDFFGNLYGNVNIFWSSKYLFNFSIIFQDEDGQRKFEKGLKYGQGLDLIKINDCDMIVFSESKYEKYLCGVRQIQSRVQRSINE